MSIVPNFVPDKNTIIESVGNKFLSNAFEAVVSTTFISALPLSDDDKRDRKTVNSLKSFAHKALESAGGYQLLIDAINNERNQSKLSLLKDLNSICYTTAMEAATRVAMEATADEEFDEDEPDETEESLEDLKIDVEDDAEEAGGDPDEAADTASDDAAEEPVEKPEEPKKKILKGKTLKELTLDARMTDQEYASLAKKAGNIDMADIAEIVNDKIIKAVNDEKKSYQQTDEANDRLKAALIERDDINEDENPEEAKEAVEGIYRLNFGNNIPREHKSLFSTLQASIAETLIATEAASFDELDVDLLTKVTCRTLPHTFTETVSLSSAVEEALSTSIAVEGWNGSNCDDVIKFASLTSIIIMTFLETLNTMNIKIFDRDDIKCAVDRGAYNPANAACIAQNVDSCTKVALDAIRENIRKSNDISDLENAMEKTVEINDKLNEVAKKGHPVSSKLLASVESIQTEINARLAKVSKGYATATEAISYAKALRNDEARRAFEGAVGRLKDRIINRWPDRVIFRINGNNIHSDMIKNNRTIATDDMTIGCALEGITATDFFKSVAKMNGINEIKLGNRILGTLIIDENGRTTI